LIGVALGLVGAALVLGLAGPLLTNNVATGLMLSDCDGPLRELVIHYTPEAAPITGPLLAEFLRQLPAEVVVHVVCPDRAAFDDLSGRVGTHSCRLSPVIVGHEITGWSRDRWLAMAPTKPGGRQVLVSPRGERGSDVWPARRGDERVGDDLARDPSCDVTSVRHELFFDGGDFAADNETVFVAPALLARNLHQTVQSRGELLSRLQGLLKRRFLLLEDAPDHHAGMFMMPVGHRTVVVGDPAAGRRLWEAMEPRQAAACFPQTPDFSEATQTRFDNVARQCAAAGYRVVRIPLVPGADRRTYLTYVNVILDERGSRPTVYMPTYRGAETLKEAARQVWQGLGYQVHTVDATAAMPYFGSLHCLVNVMRRG
jgi:hypothetical protein